MEYISTIDAETATNFIYSLPSWIYGFIAPEPISPLFKEGGMLYGLNEDFAQLMGACMVFAVLDFLIVKRFVLPKVRYFALHVICNSLVCIISWPGVKRCFTEDPLTVFHGPSDTVFGNNVIAALHLYHCIAFNLSADDIFHHLTFVLTLCAMAIPAKQVSGASVPLGGFFLSGLPGGIDYLMLTLSAHGIVSKDFQKNLYTKLNVWMRGPAMTLYVFLVFVTRIHTDHVVPTFIAIISGCLHNYNGQFYTQQAIESNALYKYKKSLEKQGLVVPEVKLNDLHNPNVLPTYKKGTAGANNKGKAVATSNDDAGDSSVMSPVSGAHVPLPAPSRREVSSVDRPKVRKGA